MKSSLRVSRSASAARLGRRWLVVLLAVVAASWLRPSEGMAQSVPLTPQQLNALAIKLSEIKPAETETRAVLPGTIVAPSNDRIAIAAPFAGTVTRLHVLAGQGLEPGRDLVTIASRDFIEALSKQEQARVELTAAELAEARVRNLVTARAAPARELEAATAVREKAQLTLEQSRRTVALGTTKANPDGSYTLLAPAAGHVVETRVLAGSSVEAMATTVVLDTTDDVWVQAQLPAALIGKINNGDTVTVDGSVRGRVIAAGNDLDPVTRSSVLVAELAPNSNFIPGQMVTVTVTRPSTRRIAMVPARAIAWIDSESYVFARSAAGFERTMVKVVSRSGDTAIIESGLEPGRQVAVSGLVQLEKMSAGQ